MLRSASTIVIALLQTSLYRRQSSTSQTGHGHFHLQDLGRFTGCGRYIERLPYRADRDQLPRGADQPEARFLSLTIATRSTAFTTLYKFTRYEALLTSGLTTVPVAGGFQQVLA